MRGRHRGRDRDVVVRVLVPKGGEYFAAYPSGQGEHVRAEGDERKKYSFTERAVARKREEKRTSRQARKIGNIL